MEAAVVDGKAAVFEFGVDIDEAFAEADVFHGVILGALDGSGHDKLERDRRSYEKSVFFLKAFGSYSEEWALLVDRVTNGQGRGEADHAIGIKL